VAVVPRLLVLLLAFDEVASAVLAGGDATLDSARNGARGTDNSSDGTDAGGDRSGDSRKERGRAELDEAHEGDDGDGSALSERNHFVRFC
jgi:hypothetical protein